MRKLIAALVFALPTLAQNSSQPATQPTEDLKAQDSPPATEARPPVRVAAVPTQASRLCSIPLLNVLPPRGTPIDKMPVIRPQGSQTFSMRFVQVPAPPCAQTPGVNRWTFRLR